MDRGGVCVCVCAEKGERIQSELILISPAMGLRVVHKWGTLSGSALASERKHGRKGKEEKNTQESDV